MMELSLTKLKLLHRAVEVTYFTYEVEYNKLLLSQKMGLPLSDLDRERIIELIGISDDYSKLRNELQICVDRHQTSLSD